MLGAPGECRVCEALCHPFTLASTGRVRQAEVCGSVNWGILQTLILSSATEPSSPNSESFGQHHVLLTYDTG